MRERFKAKQNRLVSCMLKVCMHVKCTELYCFTAWRTISISSVLRPHTRASVGPATGWAEESVAVNVCPTNAQCLLDLSYDCGCESDVQKRNRK